MPRKPKVPCRQPGCPELVEPGKLYCAKHLPLHPEVTRPASKRGYGSRWQKASKAYLQSHPLCVECVKLGRYDAWKCAVPFGNEQNPAELKGCFAFKPSTVNDLRIAQAKEEKKPIWVVATEWLEEDEFESFLQNLLMDHPFILRHTSELCYRDGTMHCLLVRCEGRREAVAVEPEGYGYARYAALVTVS